MSRNLVNVINEIVANIPEEEQNFINQLKNVQSSASYSAPELMYIWWNETYDTLCSNIPEKPNAEWQYKIMSVFSTQPIEDIKRSFENSLTRLQNNIKIKDKEERV